ncbi:hypothetical protein BJF78_32680 [Pseudonocardia sp. CNS-139]|nr:hypothetical protein BJF78_32680 [Pseudonocardia sp. CNS-139]
MRTPVAKPFDGPSTRSVLESACERAGLDPAGAQLLRLGQNAIYRLPRTAVVVRIARVGHWHDAVKEVGVAEWFARSGIPAARSWPVPQPLDVDGHPVTFWRFIDGRRGSSDDVRALGKVLRRIHALPRPDGEFLPDTEDILGRVEARIASADIPASDRAFLLGRLRDLREAIPALDFPLSPCVTHGDAHVQNLMMTDAGAVVIDFERAGWGQPEWDVAVTATEFVSAQFWTREQYQAFVGTYEFDVTDWSEFAVIRQTQELKMTTWLMQNLHVSRAVRDEYQVRMETIRTGRPGSPWRPF